MINNKLTNTLLYIMIIFNIVACFFPLLSIDIADNSLSINFIYNNGKITYGIFIIIIQILAIIFLLFKKKKIIVFLEMIACLIFAYTMYNMYIEFNSSLLNCYSILTFLDKGFYLLIVTLLGSFVLALIENNN